MTFTSLLMNSPFGSIVVVSSGLVVGSTVVVSSGVLLSSSSEIRSLFAAAFNA